MRRRTRRRLARTTLLTAGLALATTPALAEDPYVKPDNSWISLTGTVAASHADTFTLDYGEGLITVEMDDWDFFNEASRIAAGEDVTVYGRIDDDLYEMRTIEAGSVYVHDRNTYHYANDADEESDYFPYSGYAVAVPEEGTLVSVSGTVKKVEGREFILDTGIGTIQVDTLFMPYNPMDDVGFQEVDKGDRVSVSGFLDLDFFERREIQASDIVTLSRDAGKESGSDG